MCHFATRASSALCGVDPGLRRDQCGILKIATQVAGTTIAGNSFPNLLISLFLPLFHCHHAQRVSLASAFTSGSATPALAMDFTQAYKQSNFLVEFSKGAQWILTAVDDRLIVRRADSFLVERTWLVESVPITHIGWSWDSEYVFGASSKSCVVNVFKITDETWNARIAAGAEGLARVEWAPDGRSIICFSEWGVGQRILFTHRYSVQLLQLRVTIWSLTTGSATYIQFPIHPDKGKSVR